MVNSDDRCHELLKVKQDFYIYGSYDAFRTFTEYLCSCSPSADGTDIFKHYLILCWLLEEKYQEEKVLLQQMI